MVTEDEERPDELETCGCCGTMFYLSETECPDCGAEVECEYCDCD